MRVLDEQPRELKGLVADPMVEHKGYGVRENLPEQPTAEVPHVTRPNPLHGVTSHQLRKDGVYTVAKPTEEGAPFGGGVLLLGGVGGQELYAHTRQLLLGLRRMVVAIPDDQPRSPIDDLGHHAKLVDVGGSHRKMGDDAGPANPHVHAETVEGLFEESILAESGFSLEARATVGSGEQASWQRHRVADGEGGVVRSEDEELLPEALLDLPEVGTLSEEGGAVEFAYSGEPLAIMTPEVTKDRLVGAQTQELTDDLDGEDFCVGKFGQGSTCSKGPVLDSVVYEAEDGDDEGAKIHGKRPPSLRLVWAPSSVGRSPSLFNRSQKLAHGVS